MNYKLILMFLLIAPVFCQEYYADVVINVEGLSLTITGLTNHPGLISNYSRFLAYSNNYYLLNISLAGNFSNYVYELVLPKDIMINYIKTPKVMSMTYEQDKLIIKGLGSDEEFKAVVQYKLKSSNYLAYYLLILSALIIIGVIVYFKFFKKTAGRKINYSALTDRQAVIMKIVENKKEVEQRFLEKTLNMPKAAISRNVSALIRKGLIKKERKGVVNLLILA